MEKEIKKILNDLKIPITIRGYRYWNYLILNVAKKYKNNDILKVKITEEYKEMAERFKTTYTGIEKGLRYSIEDKTKIISEYFNYKENITNKEFLILVIEKLNERKQKKK